MNFAQAVLLGWESGDVQSDWRHTWPWPLWLALAILLLSTALAGYACWREQGLGRGARLLLITVRTAVIAVLIFMMFGWWISRYRTAAPDLVLVLDDSGSMSHVDGYSSTDFQQWEHQLRAIGTSEPSRWNFLRAWLLADDGRRLRQLAEKYQLKVFRAAQSLEPMPEEISALLTALHSDNMDSATDAPLGTARRQGSRLGECLLQAIQLQRGRSTAAVIIASDGITTAGPRLSDIAQHLPRRRLPLYVLGVGLEEAARDVALLDVLAPPTAFVGDLITLQARLHSSGFNGQTVVVRAWLEGQSEPHAEQTVTLDGGRQTVELLCRVNQPGKAQFRIEATPLENETNTSNNSLARSVDVRDETIRVLLVQSAPSFEFRSLNELLGRSIQRSGEGRSSIELRTLLQEADPEYIASDPEAIAVFPLTLEELFQFDVVIIGDANPRLFTRSALEHLRSFVEQRGGGLVMIAGPQFNPLAFRETPISELLPIDLNASVFAASAGRGDFRPRPTDFGAAHPILQVAASPAQSAEAWNDMPPLRWYIEAPDVRPGAWTLLEHPDASDNSGRPLPLLALRYFGAGKVVFQATDETYRWARRIDGQPYYARYWLQMLRYLSRSKLLGANRLAELRTDRAAYASGDSVQLQVRFFDDRLAPSDDDAVSVLLEVEQGRRRQLFLSRPGGERGWFEASAPGLEPGRYRAWLNTPILEGVPPTTAFEIQRPQGEMARLEMEVAELRSAAELTQGVYKALAEADQLLDQLPSGQRVQLEPLQPWPVWNSSALVSLLIVMIVGEWLLRKRWGLY